METGQKTHVIEIERQFDTDVETLFKAWTEAEHLKQWWKPMGNQLVDVKNELKEGGSVEYNVGNAGLQITGTYSEVVPNEKLVYSWIWNLNDEGSENGYTLNITFSAEGEGSKLNVVQEGFKGEEFLKTHEDGWEKGLDSLSSYLSSGGSNEEGTTSQSGDSGQRPEERDNLKNGDQMNDRSGGYNEAPEQVKVGGAEPE
ncbi:SRPBCC family protein [Dyadobacter crusticola]|uniref:SRPBCC family protein n=1 Tax=Dyadobacter crusticola TaxID=292407 RepID=UPI000691D52A|nr:SRPBCC domain-containing protein [Dyadobacter crusticola]